MGDDRARYEAWKAAGEGPPAQPAATVVLLRDGADGPETLMLRRNSKVAFVGGMWVFPGGRVDDGDLAAARVAEPAARGVDLELAAARVAAVREAAEEAGLAVAPGSLVPISHWTPPPETPRRYLTWFFVAQGPGGGVTVDGSEIHEHRWARPADAMADRDAGRIELAPPTWITLEYLAPFPDVAAVLEHAGAHEPVRYATRIVLAPEGAVALYAGDAGYDDLDADRPGPRHRLWMVPSGWRYEISAGPPPIG